MGKLIHEVNVITELLQKWASKLLWILFQTNYKKTLLSQVLVAHTWILNSSYSGGLQFEASQGK
jgi:hypothetical protein